MINFFDLIQSTRGRFFRVVFVKRSTGQLRVMVARTGVTRYLRGGTLAFDPVEKGLVIVWSVGDRGYRSIPLDGIVQLRVDGVTYTADELMERRAA